MKLCNNRSAYYALIKTGFSDAQQEQALLKLVLLVIDEKKYAKIDVRKICLDFNSKIGFNIPYFPMQNILQLAQQSGYLVYNKTKKEYTPKYDLIHKDNFMDSIIQKQEEFDGLVLSFINFTKNEQLAKYSKMDAEKIINCFIEEQGVLFFSEKTAYFNVPHDEYVFATFLKDIINTNNSEFNYVNELIVGRILSELVLYDEDVNSDNFSGTTMYLDTGFVFRVLGIDELSRKEIYIQLVKQMQLLGIEIKVFEHTYNELVGIINSSESWIGNPEYDPYIASETTRYFITNCTSKEKIIEIVTNIRSELNCLGITIESNEYPQVLPFNVKHEQEYYDIIVNYYRNTNFNFVEMEKKFTVEMDAKSFFYVNYKSNGIIANQLSDVRVLFITTNTSLATISQSVIRNIPGTRISSIPFCITDIFLGVILWKNNPASILETSYKRLVTAMYSAFMPSKEMLLKLTNNLKESEENGLLTPEQCFLLKTNKTAQRYLMNATKADPNAFTEKTPFEVLAEIYKDAKAEGRKEEREIAMSELSAIDEKLDAEKEKTAILENKDINNKIELLETQKRLVDEKINNNRNRKKELLQQKDKADKKSIRYKKSLIAGFVAFLITYMSLGVWIWTVSKETDFFGLFTFIAPIGLLILSYAYFAISGMTFNIFKWTENIIEKRNEKYYLEYKYDEKKYEELINLELQLVSDKEQYQNRINKLI